MRTYPTLIGQKFGYLTVIDRAPSSKAGQSRWLCRCDCGTEKVIGGSNLRRGTTVSCGCKKRNDLTGKKIGKLTVLERSDQYGTRGKRRVRLWKCLCDCGAITYKATDTLTNPDISMCQKCAGTYSAGKARENAGHIDGTQVSKIQNISRESDNASGARGVYYDPKTQRYRARIKFKGKLYNLGSFSNLEDAVKARVRGEEELFGAFLETQNKENVNG